MQPPHEETAQKDFDNCAVPVLMRSGLGEPRAYGSTGIRS